MTEKGGTMAERMARVEEWQDGHERRCAERQRSMGREIGEIKTDVAGLTKGAWGIVLALAGWAMVQIYSDLKSPPPPAANVTISAPAASSPR